MTTPNYTGSPASSGTPTGASAGSNDGGKKEQAQQTAGKAADEGKHVAGVAKDEARQVADEAKQQAQSLLGDAKNQVDEQSRAQRDRLVSTLQQFSSQLESMAKGEGADSGMAQDVVRQVAEKTREFSSSLDGREPTELLDEVRNFARRKPGTFLLGAAAAGLVAGRLTRGAKDANSSSGGAEGSVYDNPRGTGTGYPTAGTGYPATPAVDPVDPVDPSLDANRASGTVETGADTPWTDNPSNRGTQ